MRLKCKECKKSVEVNWGSHDTEGWLVEDEDVICLDCRLERIERKLNKL